MYTYSMISGRAWSRTRGLHGASKFLLFGLLLVVGCGGNSVPTQVGTTQVKVGDAPADSVLAFELTLTQISLTSQNGSSVNLLSGSREIELSHLAGTVESVSLANVPPGTYTKASIGFSGAEVTYIPPASTTPVEKQLTTSGTVNVSLSSPLTIGSGANVLSIDVNLSQSLVFDNTGNVTGINPVFTLSNTVVATGNEQGEESGEIEDALGAVNAAPANNSFTISLGTTGQTLTFQTNSSTQFSNGISSFGDIKQGMLVEVEGKTQADGSLLATQVELVENQGVEVEGIVTSITLPTQFTLIDDEGAGSGSSPSMIGSPITVNLSASTTFKADVHGIDTSNLSFSFTAATNLAKGQSVEVENSAAIQNGTLNADKVVLAKQALTGSVSNAAISGSSGTFTLTVPADSAFAKISGVSTVTVHQQSGTQLNGLTTVSNGANVRVRGLLFFDGTNYQFVAEKISLP